MIKDHQVRRLFHLDVQGVPRERAALRAGCQFQLHRFQPADLVAQTGSFLELQIGRGRAHAFFEIRNGGLEIMADMMQRALVAGRDRDMVAFIDALEDIADRLLDRFRRPLAPQKRASKWKQLCQEHSRCRTDSFRSSSIDNRAAPFRRQ